MEFIISQDRSVYFIKSLIYIDYEEDECESEIYLADNNENEYSLGTYSKNRVKEVFESLLHSLKMNEIYYEMPKE